MLLNILPGLRELRAPLAAGYLWLLAGWLAFGSSISVPTRAEDFLDQFSALGQAAALTFGAYIVGSLLSDVMTPIWERLRAIRLSAAFSRWYGTVRDKIGEYVDEAMREEEVAEEMEEPEADDGAPSFNRAVAVWLRSQAEYLDATYAAAFAAMRAATEPVSVRGLRTIAGLVTPMPPDFSAEGDEEVWSGPDPSNAARAVARELDVARFRLLAEQRDLFNEVDRLRGEAHFRLAVAAPLAALAITLAFSEHVVWLAAVAPVLVLAWQGMDKLEESGDRVADALRAGKVHIPALGPRPEEPDRPAEPEPMREAQPLSEGGG